MGMSFVFVCVHKGLLLVLQPLKLFFITLYLFRQQMFLHLYGEKLFFFSLYNGQLKYPAEMQ